MGLATSGIYSGINVEDVVSKLMELERKPIIRLKRKEAEYEAKISGLGSLLSSLSSLKTSLTGLKDGSLASMKAVPADTTIFTASAESTASAATYNVKVVTVASAQGIYSSAFTAETDPVADLSTHATQKLQIQVGSGAAATVTIDSSNNTLAGIKDAINGADAGVRASIVNDGSGHRLVLSSNSTGAANRIMVKVDEDNDGVFEEDPDEIDTTGLSKLAFNATYDSSGNVTGGVVNMLQSQVAQDASLVVDGLTVTKSSNTITDVITGVTLNLKKDSAGSTVTLEVSKDATAATSKVSAFVSAYNKAMSTIKDLRGSINQKGALGSDSTISSLRNTLRAISGNSYGGISMVDLGISCDKDGVMSVDSSKLESKLAEDQQGVVDAFNAMASPLGSLLDTYVEDTIPDKKEGYTTTVKLLADREKAMESRLDKVELNLIRKFNNLDQTLARLQSQGNYVSQQLSSLSRSIGGSK